MEVRWSNSLLADTVSACLTALASSNHVPILRSLELGLRIPPFLLVSHVNRLSSDDI